MLPNEHLWVRSRPFSGRVSRFAEFLALESKELKLGGSSFGIRPSIYVLKGCCDESPLKRPITVILEAKLFFPPSKESQPNTKSSSSPKIHKQESFVGEIILDSFSYTTIFRNLVALKFLPIERYGSLVYSKSLTKNIKT